MKSAELRTRFLDFFKEKKHRIVESDSLVPRDDPTVLFTPAGMNQFKKEFMGFDAGFKRAATCQRCLRTDDLDKVGRTSGHHTFFEMLGNFSFGDYFKKQAIGWAWEFLTGVLGLSPQLLWVSVYKDDEEAYDIWKKEIRVPVGKIVRLGDKENFWPSEAKQKGPNGPCGPCSEIFYDQGAQTGCRKPGCSPACDCGRFLEVWNLVFTQYNRLEDGRLEPLPNKNIDTGMGLERLCAVMQGVSNNFETDLFVPVVKEIVRRVPRAPGQKEALYAVSDHLRAVTFCLYDGVHASNEGRGYVVRKLIRKSILALRSQGIEQPFFYTLVPVVARIMEPAYPELKERQEMIAQAILSEEKNFCAMLDSSPALLEEKFAGMKKKDPEKAGTIAFTLYDTYGLPVELTRKWLADKGMAMSDTAFESELSRQKERSKLGSSMKGDVFGSSVFDYGAGSTVFSGYKNRECRATVLNLVVTAEGVPRAAKKISAGDKAVLILDKSVFYAESGGQVGDKGLIKKGKSVFRVEDTQKSGKVVLHMGTVEHGSFKKADEVSALVDAERRLAVARNHTATHMLQAALRQVLGAHVKQQGSLVAQDRLRFDFTHFKKVSDEELSRVEDLINKEILADHPLVSRPMSLAEAKKSGALAFFGEKYSGTVRVVAVGSFSRELCAGTHLDSTGQVGIFRIVSEGSVAGGIRRIEAVTGSTAYALIKEREQTLSEELRKKDEQIKELQRCAGSRKQEGITSSAENILKKAEPLKGNVQYIFEVIDNADMNSLRSGVDLVKAKSPARTVVVIGSRLADDKALVVAGVTQDLIERGFSAVDFVNQICRHIGGKGGGRPDFAQGGGSDPSKFGQGTLHLKAFIEHQLLAGGQ